MRLTIALRKTMAEELTLRKFKPKIEELIKWREELAKAVADELPEPPTTDKDWVIYRNEVRIEHPELRHNWYVRDKMERRYHINNTITLDKSQPMPIRLSQGGELVLSANLKKRFDRYTTRVSEVYDEMEATHRDLRRIFDSVNTFKQLQVAWPEGLPLYRKYFTAGATTTALVDATLINKVTAAFTPPLPI